MCRMEKKVKRNERLTKILEDRIYNFYNLDGECASVCTDHIRKYSKYKRFFLYPVTIMNGNVLGILTSIATCLSMNIFTNFISFQRGSSLDLIIWILRFTSAIILNVCIGKLSIICTILKDKDMENRANGILRPDRLMKRLDEYDSIYDTIRKDIVWGIGSMLFLFFLIIIFPIGEFLFTNRGTIEMFMQSVYLRFDELIRYMKMFN